MFSGWIGNPYKPRRIQFDLRDLLSGHTIGTQPFGNLFLPDRFGFEQRLGLLLENVGCHSSHSSMYKINLTSFRMK